MAAQISVWSVGRKAGWRVQVEIRKMNLVEMCDKTIYNNYIMTTHFEIEQDMQDAVSICCQSDTAANLFIHRLGASCEACD